MKLNEKQIREKYKLFEGRISELAQQIKEDKRKILSMNDIIERRLNSKQEDWRKYYFDTSDCIIKNGDEIKIIKNCKLLINLKEKQIEECEFKITKQQYKKLKGKVFKIKDLDLDYLTNKKAKKHPIWNYLINKKLLNKYVDLVFSDFKKTMKIYLPSTDLVLRAWCVDRLGGRSDADGGDVLANGIGRLVGIASEMQGDLI